MWTVAGVGLLFGLVLIAGVVVFDWPSAVLEMGAVLVGIAMVVTPLIERAKAKGATTPD